MIKISKNTLGDSRTAEQVPSFNQFQVANKMHIADVTELLKLVSHEFLVIGADHDFTKTQEFYQSLFYRELCNSIEGKMNFKEGEWYKNHVTLERHHLNEHVPYDVNLFDVFEMIADCICAGLARSGKVREVNIEPEVLQMAFENTVKLLASWVEVEENE